MWRPFDVATGDLDRDGWPDAVVTDFNAQSIVVWFNQGDGTLGPKTEYPLPAQPGPTGLVVTDLNRDHRPDVAFVSGAPQLHVMLTNADGGLGAPISTPTSGAGYQLAAGDLDRNGWPDLIVGTRGAGVDVVLGDGVGGFSTAVTYPTFVAEEATGTGVGDINGDGRLDVVAAGFVSQEIAVLLGAGDGTLGDATLTPTGAFGIREIAVADINRDRRSDLVITNESCQCLFAFVANGLGSFDQVTGPTGYGQARAVAVANLDGDKDPDIVGAGAFNVTAAYGTKSGHFPDALGGSFTDGISYGVAGADLDRDGRGDIVATDEFGSLLTLINTTSR